MVSIGRQTTLLKIMPLAIETAKQSIARANAMSQTSICVIDLDISCKDTLFIIQIVQKE
jgi:hypothetical protein